MKAWAPVLFAFFLSFFPLAANADDSEAYNKLLTAADQVYEATANQQFETAGNDLKRFSDLWDAEGDALAGTVTDRAIAAAEEKLRKALASGDEAACLKAAESFRLAVDAALHRNQPIWLGMKAHVLAAFHKVKSDVVKEDDRALQRDLNEFMDVYDRIYPSLVIATPSARLKAVDLEIDRLDDERMTIVQDQDRQKQAARLDKIERDLRALFQDKSVEPVIGAPWNPAERFTAFVIGGCIGATLLYVSWRKYRGERAKNRHISFTK